MDLNDDILTSGTHPLVPDTISPYHYKVINQTTMTPITTAAPITVDERNMLLGQLRLGKTGTQILEILDVITADYAQPLKYNNTVVPDCFVNVPTIEEIQF